MFGLQGQLQATAAEASTQLSCDGLPIADGKDWSTHFLSRHSNSWGK